MKLEITQLDSGYTLEIVNDATESKQSAFQSLQGVLLSVIEICALNDPRAKTVSLRQKYDARFKCILDVMKASGKEMTINEVSIRTADSMGKDYSAHFRRGVAVALANAATRPKSGIERVGDIRSGLYRYRSMEDSP